MTHVFRLVGAVCVLLAAAVAHADVSVASIFTSGMVLQREHAVPVWGWAEPGEQVTVKFADQVVTTIAAADRRWKVALKPMPAESSPREMIVSTPSNSLRFENVLVGEVWLCSGQSNIQWEVRLSANAKEEIAAANYPEIRMFTAVYAPGEDRGYKIDPTLAVKRFALRPRDRCLGTWKVCNPVNVPNFSGVAYYFGRRIHQELKVPVGLIVSGFGATAIESWISIDGLKAVPAYRLRAEAFELLAKEYLEKPEDFKQALNAQNARLEEQTKAWLAKLDAEDRGILSKWMSPEFDSSKWDVITLPVSMENNPIGSPVASIWFQKVVTIPQDWIGKDLDLSLGLIDAVDETYVNGVRVGRTWFDTPEFWLAKRNYVVPASAVKSTRVVIALRLLKLAYHMAPLGPAEIMRLEVKGVDDGPTVALAGEWRMCKAQDLDAGQQPRPAALNAKLPGNHYGDPGVMHNGLIHPIQPYAIRGVVWYQAAANGPYYVDYRSLMPGLITSWRKEWGQGDFPFGMVQQQDFWEQQTKPVERGGYTNIRQSQAMALSLPGTFMATAVGVGEANNSHPKNKQEVGRRLALAALGPVYGRKDLLYSSPVYKSMKIEGSQIRLTFDFAKGMHAKGDPPVGFAIAGADRAFYFAKAKIENDQVVVWSEKVPHPVAVRYAWATNPVCNLYNEQDLPIFPFATDTWDLAQLVIPKDETVTIPTGWVPK